jgi:hypothetical protein
MNDLVFVCFSYFFSEAHSALVAELIRNVPSSVTSIYLPESRHLPAIQRDTPLFINDYHGLNKIETFLHDSQSQLAHTRRTHMFIDTDGHSFSVNPATLGLWRGSKIAVSFFGPRSGNLILKLTHASPSAATLVLKEPLRSRTFKYHVPSSLSITTITFSPNPSFPPSIVPNARNNLIIEVTGWHQQGYVLQDIQLHDEAGNDYNPVSPEA